MNTTISRLPNEVQNFASTLLCRDPQYRPTAIAVQTNPYFSSTLMNALKFIESFVEKTTMQKSTFLKGVAVILPRFGEKIRIRKVHDFRLILDSSSPMS